LTGWLKTEAGKSRKKRRTVTQLQADLVVPGFTGSCAWVTAFAHISRAKKKDPGDRFPGDWEGGTAARAADDGARDLCAAAF